MQQPAGTEVGADAGVGVVGTIALRRQVAEQVGDARSRREGVEVIGADGHGARRAYARRLTDDRGVVPSDVISAAPGRFGAWTSCVQVDERDGWAVVRVPAATST